MAKVYDMSDKQSAPTLSITPEQLQEILAKTVESAVKAAREPDAATKQKLEEEAKLAEHKRQQMVELAKVEEQMRKEKWENCSHTKENGKPCVSGQIHSDGLVHLICLRCQYPFPPFPPTQDMRATGI